MADKEKKSTMKGFATNDQADYYSEITSITVNGKNAYELKGKFLDDLHNNAFSGTNGEDAVEHIKYFLKIVDPINLPNVNHDKLRVVVFPISLVGDAWRWFDGIKGSITRASISVMPLSTYLNFGLGELAHTKLTVELADRTVKYPKGIAENVLVGIGKFVFLVDFIILDMPKDIKVPLILERPFLSTIHAKINVFKRKITLRGGEEKIIFKSVKPASSLIKSVYMLSLRERMELDLEARLMGETLVLNRSLDPFFGDYIELNDLNVPLELRRHQVDDLMPTIEEGEEVEEFRARNDARMVSKIFGYPSDCNQNKKIRIDCAHNLKKDKLEYKGNNVVGALMNIPIFVGTFSILTDFAVLEDMDAYRDEKKKL
ncbi:putative reverse transcriptase domain-containing protein [Tanacetum coccineum]|uniref:Reverse transcriptase domain-containing protein n=1 Tax=Tanacetum coccineum TaxID=301880 RepID=A0ABQ5DZ95_9ASTR